MGGPVSIQKNGAIEVWWRNKNDVSLFTASGGPKEQLAKVGDSSRAKERARHFFSLWNHSKTP